MTETHAHKSKSKELTLISEAPINGLPIFSNASPFQTSGELLYVPEGLNLAEIVLHLFPRKDIPYNTHIMIGRDYIPQHMWPHVRPKKGATITISIVPQGGGGGGKNPLRTVLQLAIIAAAFTFGGPLGATLLPGASLATQAAVGGFIISAVGSLLINALAPPPLPRIQNSSRGSSKESPTLFIEGARNSVNKYGVVPVVLGKHRFVPPLAALTYTEAVDNVQFVRQLFCWGYGDLLLTNISIGETLLSAFTNFETEDILDGTSGTSTLSLFPSDVFQEQLALTLTQVAGYQTRTSQINADELLIDITLPQGLVQFNDKGNRTTISVTLEIEYGLTGSGIWTSASTLTLTNNTTAAIRKTIRIITGARAQYDVRVRRTSADNLANDQIFDSTSWTALKTITNQNPVNLNGINLTAIRIQASDQLNGALDQFNAIVSNKIPDWNGTAWVVRETSNPAAIFKYIAQNSFGFPLNSDGDLIGPNAVPLNNDRVNLADLQVWHDYCASEGYEYNGVVDYDTSVREILQEVAAAGRASMTIKDGQWSIVIDNLKPIVSQWITPKNSSSYTIEHTFADAVHAFRVLFINEEIGYLEDEMLVYDDGYTSSNATKIETLDLPGITKPDLIWKHGREYLAAARLRPRRHSFTMDIEHLTAPRGARCKLATDVINVGLYQGRIKTITVSGTDVVSITTDEEVTMQDTIGYGIVIRTAAGLELIKPVDTTVGTTNTITFTTPFDLAASGLAADNLFMFGVLGAETIDIIIKEIIPRGDFAADIVALDYSPAIFDAATGTIPAFNSGATYPPELDRPLPPALVSLQTAEEVQVINTDGSISSRAVFTLENVNVGNVVTSVKYRVTGTDSFQPAQVVSSTPEQIVLAGFDIGTRYDFELRYQRTGAVAGLVSNIISAPLVLNNQEFIGTSSPPPDVTDFQVQLIATSAFFTWAPVSVLDFDHYEIRFNPATAGVTWNGATTVQNNITSTTLTTPAQKGTYLIKAFDRGNNESVNETVIINTIQSTTLNVVAAINEHSTFLGTHSNTKVSGSALELTNTSSNGVYTFAAAADVGQVFTSRISPVLEVVGNNLTNLMSGWTTLDSVATLSGTDPSAWNVLFEIRTTQTDPTGTPVWSSWAPIVLGDYTFWGAEFRVTLSTVNTDVTPSITKLGVSVDMPDRIIRFQDESITAGGKTLAVSPNFKALVDVQVTGQNMQQGDYWEVTNKTASGVKIEFFNSGGTSVTRIADVQLGGYGSIV